MFAIDWRMGLALLVTIPVALIPMTFGMRTYNKNYAAYMEANAHVNSVIVEYVEGIQVVKAFSQGERSYQKFAQAVASFRDFTMGWFRCTWASMNLCLSILPTTLLGTLPAGVALYQAGILDPAQVTLCPVSYTHLDVYKRQEKDRDRRGTPALLSRSLRRSNSLYEARKYCTGIYRGGVSKIITR